MASAYLREGRDIGPYDFRDWIGGLSSERIQVEFELQSPLLEDVARKIPLVGINPLMATFNHVEEFLPTEVAVEGTQHGNRALAARAARPGDRVNVRRDYDNATDRNAVALYLNGREIGYLPRQVAQVLAPEIDTGREVTATILTVRAEPIPAIRIKLT